MTSLKRIRIEKHMTQQEVANRIGVSLRSYLSYENDESKEGTPKYRFILRELENIDPIDEEHGILSMKDIISICDSVFSKYNVEYCYLFGSYSKGKATEKSDVDLIISTTTTGLKYYELVEKLREKLHKKVDLLDVKQLLKNEELLSDVLKEGIKIYG
ncbi:MAG: helix-turn-helix domain-containing protein [Lachnospiraceae bacterium]|nr:helix-turn-helix domain-containing protein [Lachnospiraceae bacterium]